MLAHVKHHHLSKKTRLNKQCWYSANVPQARRSRLAIYFDALREEVYFFLVDFPDIVFDIFSYVVNVLGLRRQLKQIFLILVNAAKQILSRRLYKNILQRVC